MSDEETGETPTDTTEPGGIEQQPAHAPDQGTDDKPDVSGLQSALEKERALRKAAEKAAKEGDKHRARVEELEAANQSETEKAVAAARKEGAVEARKAADTRLVRAEARALAAESRFRDPARVVRLLDPAPEVTVTTDPRSLARLVGHRVRAEDGVAGAVVTAHRKRVRVKVTGRFRAVGDLRDRARETASAAVGGLPLQRGPRVSVSVSPAKER